MFEDSLLHETNPITAQYLAVETSETLFMTETIPYIITPNMPLKFPASDQSLCGEMLLINMYVSI